MAPMKFSPPAGRRGGFTLVELLVAAGLSVLVMAILATAFQKGMETLSHLKSTVTLSQQLRGVESVIRGDLGATHLIDGSTGATVRVSDRDRLKAGWNAPNKGYFHVEMQTSLADGDSGFVLERQGDVSEPDSYRATNHSMRFTVRLLGGTPQDLFRASVPLASPQPSPPPSPPLSRLPALMAQSESMGAENENTVFGGVWAEVRYFLVANNSSTTNADGSQGVPLYTLYRRVRVLAPNTIDQTVDVPADFPEVSYRPDPGPPAAFKVNTPATVIDPANRLPMSKLTGVSEGADVLLSNVVSMQILPMLDPVPTTSGVVPSGATASAYLEYPGDTNSSANPKWSFDTANPTVVTTTPLVYRSLKAVQLKLRVYDPRNRVTRQVTIAQDL